MPAIIQDRQVKILIVNNTIIPAKLYGGTERVIWALGKEMVKLGHEVTYLVREGSYCDFARVIPLNPEKKIGEQVPAEIDFIHFNFRPDDIHEIKKPYLVTMHGNLNASDLLDVNTVFVSENHARRFGSDSFVHNGLDWDEYTKPDLNNQRKYFHFLGDAAWRVKNVKGAIDIINRTGGEKLKVLGGVRFNFNMGIRLTFSPKVRFYGMVGGSQKDKLLNGSKGLIFPVRWHEPFGLALIESLYFGCPVFGTPYGSLPEIIKEDIGYLSASMNELADAIKHSSKYSTKRCHEYATDMFNSKIMALSYLEKYNKVLNGEKLNPHPPQLLEIQKAKFLPWN